MILNVSMHAAGEFGVVYKGHIVKDLGQTITGVVAVKTLKGKSTQDKFYPSEINSQWCILSHKK